jgi:hypothetical protein
MKRPPVARIHFSSEDYQDVFFNYEYSEENGLFIVTSLKLKIMLFGNPTDLIQDLSVAISEDLGLEDERYVRIDCEVEQIAYNVESKIKAA